MLKSSIINSFLAAIAFMLYCPESPGRDTLHLSLDNARDYALEHNINLINAGLAIDEADLSLRETIAGGLPQISAEADYSYYFESTATIGMGPQEMEITFDPTSNLVLSAGQMIFSGSYFVGVQMARLYQEVSEASHQRTEIEVLSQVIQAYYLVLVSLESKKIIASNLKNMEEVLEKTRAMVEAGVVEELDYDQLSVQAFMLEDALADAERQVELAVNMLRIQMGVDVDREIELTDNLGEILEMADFEGSLISPFRLEDNVDYQMMQLQANIAEKQVDMERAAYLPSATGFYTFTEKLIKPEFDITPNHVLGVNVSIPIFSSGERRSRVSQARVNLKSVENEKKLLTDQLKIEERQLRFNLINAIRRYESHQANVRVAKRVYEDTYTRYEQGLASSINVTTTHNTYLEAENSYISSVLHLLEAHIELDKLLHDI